MSVRTAVARASLRGVAAMVTRSSWRALDVLGAALGWFFGRIACVRRRHVVSAMRRAGLARPDGEADAMYRGLSTGLLELLWLAGADASRWDEALDTVVFEPASLRLLHEARARGPVVLAAAHTGNWELVAYAAARELRRRGSFLAAVVKPLSVRSVHAFCMHLRRRAGLRLLAPEGALSASRGALAEGGVVVMPVDQVPRELRHGAVVPFLGAPVWADVAPAAFAKRVGARLLVVGAVREGRGHRVRILAELSPRRREPDFVARATAGIAASLEGFVSAHPSCWMWLHRRWRAPLGAVPRGPGAVPRGSRAASCPAVDLAAADA